MLLGVGPSKVASFIGANDRLDRLSNTFHSALSLFSLVLWYLIRMLTAKTTVQFITR